MKIDSLTLVLGAMCITAISIGFMRVPDETPVEPVQIALKVEVTKNIYRQLAVMMLSCDVEAEAVIYMEDDMIDLDEAEALGDLCVKRGTQASGNPFAEGQVRHELKRVRTGGVEM